MGLELKLSKSFNFISSRHVSKQANNLRLNKHLTHSLEYKLLGLHP